MDGLAGAWVRASLYIVTFMEMLAAGFMTHMMSMLVLSVSKVKNKKPLLIALIPLVMPLEKQS
ncbi:MAG: hypothetical protein IKH57_14085 [Clostridia bacterium]|nr:hypothetical protein [Clostridia bacterium]